MEYAKLFLERADGLKYRLYHLLAQPFIKDVTITDLASRLNTKYPQVYNIFQEVLDDVVLLTHKPRERVRSELLEGNCLPLSLDAYRSYLMQGSLLYRLVDYVTTAPHPTCAQFCQRVYISRSTVTRKVKLLNTMLSDYHLKFKLVRFEFAGEEVNIRYFLYTVYWWAHRGTAWPFKRVIKTHLQEELAAISIVAEERPIEALQEQVFWAVSHLRAGKHKEIQPTPYLTFLDQQVEAFGLRQATVPPPFSWVDVAAFNFFQLSQPRFDARRRTPQAVAQEAAILMDDATQMVVDTLSAAIYRPALGDFDDDLYLNLLRLCGGMRLMGGAFIQAQDLLGGGINLALGDTETVVAKVVNALQDTDAFASIAPDVGFFSQVVARLVAPYCLAANTERFLHIDLAVDQALMGYRELAGLVSAVPWVAQVGPSRDWVIGCPDTPDRGAGEHFVWYAGALDLPVYRESLIQELLAQSKRKQLVHAIQ